MGIKTNYSKKDREQARKGRAPFPPEGEYPATVEDALEKESRAGNDMAEVLFNVHAEDRTIKRKAWFVYSQQERVINLVDALARDGDPEEITPQSDGTINEFLGRHCRVVIKHEPDDSGKVWANIDRLLPPNGEQLELEGGRGRRGASDDEDEESPF